VELLAWVDASTRASVLAGYAEAAAAAGIDLAGPAEQVAARFAGWLAGTARPWLVVLDDLRDRAVLDGLWPGGPAGMVLITAADGDTLADQPAGLRAQVFAIGAFSTREALNYLMGRLINDPDQRHGATDLALGLDCDPCALAHASAVIATTTNSCRDYQDRYAGMRARLTARQASGKPPPALAVTWILSAERAEQLSPGGATQPLLALAALLGGPAIPGPVFTAPATGKYLAEARRCGHRRRPCPGGCASPGIRRTAHHRYRHHASGGLDQPSSRGARPHGDAQADAGARGTRRRRLAA
jgi:hypothetical protein